MRDYAQISPRFWTGDTGKRLRGHTEAQLVALYLMSAPGSHMIGMYPLEIPTLCHHTGFLTEGATKGLARLAALDFAYFDDVAELVWVPEMAHFQIAKTLKRGDKRIKGVEKELENYRKSRFFNLFLDKYRNDFNLHVERDPDSPTEGPRKPLPSQDQEQEQEQDQEQKGSSPTSPKNPATPTPSIAELESDWPAEILVRVKTAVTSTRRSGQMAEGPWREFLLGARQFSPEVRVRAANEYLDRACAADKKTERYLLGIMRGENSRGQFLINGGRKGYVPLTGTADRFKDLADDSEALGLKLEPKPKPKESSGG
jgi:hypothetical protein